MSNNIGSLIKTVRKEKGYTLKDLSLRAGISISFLSDIENGRSNPSLERLKDIANSLDTPVAFFLGDTQTVLNFEKVAPESKFRVNISEMPCNIAEQQADYSDIKNNLKDKKNTLTKKDEKDISKILKQTKEQLENSEGLMFDGEPASPEAIESILQAMEMGMALAKQKNKEKYTPQKYKKANK